MGIVSANLLPLSQIITVVDSVVCSLSLSIRSVAWFCSVEIGGAMVVGLVWVFCVVGLWWSVVVLVYWVYDFFFGSGFTSGGGV